MASPLDTRIGIGKEATYGTAVAPTRHYEARSDPWTRGPERIDSGGFRQSRQAQRSDRDTQIDMGASGSIETPVFDAGMGLLLEDLLGANTAPSQIGATGVYNHVFSTDTDGPDTSWTVQVVRVLGTTEYGWDYAGCIPTGFSLGVSQGELLMLTVNYDARSEGRQASPVAGVYTANTSAFNWSQCRVSIDGSNVDTFQSFSLDGDLMLETALHFLKGSADKDLPRRSGVPTFNGTLEGLPTDLDLYDKFVAADTIPISLTATKGSGATLRSFTVSMPACKLTGATPNAQLEGLTTQSVPFSAFHDGTRPVLTITVQTPDSAF